MTELCQGPDSNTRVPRLKAPPGATDAHFHMFGPASRYPYADDREYTPPDATPQAARKLFDALGIQRVVAVQASVYKTDNRAQLEGAAAIGLPFRAVVTLPKETSDAELDRMDELGACGMRFILAHEGGLSPDDLEYYADRMKEIGWHIQLMVRPAHLIELGKRLERLSCSFVIDHMGMVKPGEGLTQPAFQILLNLLKTGHGWAKISGAYRLSEKYPNYDDLAPFVRALVATAPRRLVWGSDWPHPVFKGTMPNDADLLDVLLDWVPDAGVRQSILCDNPAALYGF
jgi:predicted TIM-barrel fold metal-dependent hydrolase